MKTQEMLTYAGLGLGVYMLVKQSSPKAIVSPTTTATVPKTTPVTTSPYVNTAPAATSQPSTVSVYMPSANGQALISADSGMTQAQYDAARTIRPDAIGNPAYRLTDGEAGDYLANYLDLRQGLPSWINKKDVLTIQDAARKHWGQWGAAEKRSFIPFNPPATKPYTVPAANAKSSGGGSWVTTALSVAGTVVAMLGVNDDPGLNDAEIEVLMTGSAIVSDILPFFPGDLPVKIKDRMETLITYYS